MTTQRQNDDDDDGGSGSGESSNWTLECFVSHQFYYDQFNYMIINAHAFSGSFHFLFVSLPQRPSHNDITRVINSINHFREEEYIFFFSRKTRSGPMARRESVSDANWFDVLRVCALICGNSAIRILLMTEWNHRDDRNWIKHGLSVQRTPSYPSSRWTNAQIAAAKMRKSKSENVVMKSKFIGRTNEYIRIRFHKVRELCSTCTEYAICRCFGFFFVYFFPFLFCLHFNLLSVHTSHIPTMQCWHEANKSTHRLTRRNSSKNTKKFKSKTMHQMNHSRYSIWMFVVA